MVSPHKTMKTTKTIEIIALVRLVTIYGEYIIYSLAIVETCCIDTPWILRTIVLTKTMQPFDVVLNFPCHISTPALDAFRGKWLLFITSSATMSNNLNFILTGNNGMFWLHAAELGALCKQQKCRPGGVISSYYFRIKASDPMIFFLCYLFFMEFGLVEKKTVKYYYELI